ncbi:MAG TPA: zf-HC2 domain-containing protein [Verrucomicrobiae bacterium]|nr:zf-HC2 domain-containing protein [Verrucomicrobiae bacterium]
MSCQTIKGQFDERLDGRLSDPQQAAFDEHVATCADCRREWEAYAGAWEVMERHTGIEPSFGFVERTLRRLDEPPTAVRTRFWQPAFRWAALATAVIALAVGAWIGRERVLEQRRVEIYASVRQAEYLEDFDVIANLDQLKEGNKL